VWTALLLAFCVMAWAQEEKSFFFRDGDRVERPGSGKPSVSKSPTVVTCS